jgi:DNA recombination protein RmuC
LFKEIKTLHEINQQSKDATNLTNALKGQAKTQGNWGEFILESILEKSGLKRDREYLIQASMQNEESGKKQQPDVIINLA